MTFSFASGSVLDFLDEVESQVRQRADSIRLEQEARRLPQSPLELSSRYQIPRSEVFEGRGRGGFSITETRNQYKHFQGEVYATIRVIAHRISAQPFYVARRTNDEERSLARRIQQGLFEKRALPGWVSRWVDLQNYEVLDSHPLINLLEVPNDWMVHQNMMDFTLANLLVTGRSFWVLSQSASDERAYDIVPVPTTWVQPVHTPKPFSAWQIKPPSRTDDQGLIVDRRFVLHFYLPDPSTPFGAVSPLNMLARAILNSEAIAEAQHSAFRNEGMPSVALLAGDEADAVASGAGAGPVALTPEQRQEIIDWFRQEYAGPVRQGLPIVLDAIIKDIKILSRNPKEMAFLESSGVTKEQIFSGFGVPQVAAGIFENVTRDAAAVADRHLCQNVLNPIIRMLSQTMQRVLVPLFSRRSEDLILWIEEAYPADQELELEKWQRAAAYFAPTLNEWRRFIGLPPLPGGNVIVVPQRARLVDITSETPREVLGIGDREANLRDAGTPDSPEEDMKLLLPTNGNGKPEVGFPLARR